MALEHTGNIVLLSRWGQDRLNGNAEMLTRAIGPMPDNPQATARAPPAPMSDEAFNPRLQEMIKLAELDPAMQLGAGACEAIFRRDQARPIDPKRDGDSRLKAIVLQCVDETMMATPSLLFGSDMICSSVEGSGMGAPSSIKPSR